MIRYQILVGLFLFFAAVSFALISPCLAADPAPIVWNGSTMPEGVYFHWYEPSTYVGFAPRTQDPKRVHVRLSRGNQVRVTMVIGSDELENYLSDLVLRQDVLNELIQTGVVELTTNTNYERYTNKLAELRVREELKRKQSDSVEQFRARALSVMSELNPGRIFSIRIPWANRVSAWRARLGEHANSETFALPQKLDAANALLPGRLNLHEFDQNLETVFASAVSKASALETNMEVFTATALSFLEAASQGFYKVRDGYVEAIEFSAIYPAGTVDFWTNYQGKKIPDFGVTGVWKLIPRDKGRGILGMVDYLSTNPGYGYIPMLPYQYAGGIEYNAFHNAGVRAELAHTPFFPQEWKSVPGERNPSKNYQNLWIISRGPTSHGCTRLASGHMSEFRQTLPSESKKLEGLKTFRNLPQCYDVFDIDGNGTLEVVGVKYYLAFRSKERTPVKAYAQNERKAFYQWLYGDSISYDDRDNAIIRDVPVCRFNGRKAEEAALLHNIPLHEAANEPEKIQFYRTKTVPFDSVKGFELNRELGRVAIGYQTNRAKLLLGK